MGSHTLIVGTTTVDIFLTALEGLPVLGDDEFTMESVCFLDRPVTMTLGGNGANSAYALAGLGAVTSLCSPLGADALGGLVSDWLSLRNVGVEGLARRDSWATACTVVAMDASLHRLSFHHAGGSAEYSPDDVPADLMARADCVLATSYHILPRFRGDGFAGLLSAARRAGAATALDLGPAIEPVAGLAELRPLLAHADYVFANVRELVLCTGADDAEGACEAILAAGAGAVVVKRGGDGAGLRSRHARVDVPGFPVVPSRTVGAGDAFDAGFLHSVSSGRSLEGALRFANAVAALVIEAPQGVLASPEAERVEEFLSRR